VEQNSPGAVASPGVVNGAGDMRDEIREDVSKSIRGAIFFAVPIIVIVLVVYTIATGGMQ
jgi:hypothetical protein